MWLGEKSHFLQLHINSWTKSWLYLTSPRQILKMKMNLKKEKKSIRVIPSKAEIWTPSVKRGRHVVWAFPFFHLNIAVILQGEKKTTIILLYIQGSLYSITVLLSNNLWYLLSNWNRNKLTSLTKKFHLSIYLSTHTHTHIYIYMCVCVCVCVILFSGAYFWLQSLNATEFGEKMLIAIVLFSTRINKISLV